MAVDTLFLPRCGRLLLLAAVPFSVAALPAQAQDGSSDAGSPDYLENLKTCQSIADDAARLACFDTAVGSMVAATETGDVQVVDREDVRQTRRSLFGFSLPDLGIFGADDEDEDELFTTTIERVRYTGRNSARITTVEGAVWEMNNIPRSRRPFEAGDTVEFKGAALGYYFLRIGGQMGVKGRRIE